MHQLWVQLQSRKTSINLSRNVVELYILVTLRKKYSKSVSAVFNEIFFFFKWTSNEIVQTVKKDVNLKHCFSVSFLRYNMLLCTSCHISSRKIMSILCFVLFPLPVVIYFHISDKLVIARWPRTILANIFLLSHILLLFHSPEGSWNKS